MVAPPVKRFSMSTTISSAMLTKRFSASHT
jgi:hypothetical protein